MDDEATEEDLHGQDWEIYNAHQRDNEEPHAEDELDELNIDDDD